MTMPEVHIRTIQSEIMALRNEVTELRAALGKTDSGASYGDRTYTPATSRGRTPRVFIQMDEPEDAVPGDIWLRRDDVEDPTDTGGDPT